LEKSRQNYDSPVATDPDPLVARIDATDELREIQLDTVLSGKVRQLWRHRRPLARFMLVGLVVCVAIALLLPKWYESTVVLMPPDQNSSIMNAMMMSGSGGNAGLGLLGLLGMKTSGAIYMRVLGSDSVCNNMIDRFDLMKDYGTSSRERALKIFRSKVDISEDRKSNVITVSVQGRSPDQAQAMAKAYIDELSKVMNRVSTSSARRERQFLEQRVAAVKADQDQAAKELSEFASKNVMLEATEQAKATVTAAARLQGELVAAESELQGMEQIYTENNVRVKYLRGRIAELRRQLPSDTNADVPATGGGDTLNQYIRNLPKLGVTWAQMYRRVMIDETVYEALSKQLELAKVQEAKEIPTVSVLDEANKPERKAYPKLRIVVLVGLALWFLVGAAWFLALDYWNGMDARDERKVFVQGMLAPVAARWPGRKLEGARAGELADPRNEK
jgi:capsule polysaccharide export protein KpsE/RkpR